MSSTLGTEEKKRKRQHHCRTLRRARARGDEFSRGLGYLRTSFTLLTYRTIYRRRIITRSTPLLIVQFVYFPSVRPHFFLLKNLSIKNKTRALFPGFHYSVDYPSAEIIHPIRMSRTLSGTQRR